MYTMIEPELPVATEISEPLLEIVIVEPLSSEIQRQRDIYNRNVRELSLALTITTSMSIFYILYLFAPNVF
jgi:hypothetical protein